MMDDDIIKYYRIEYNKEYTEAVKSGIVPSAKALRERFGFSGNGVSFLQKFFG